MTLSSTPPQTEEFLRFATALAGQYELDREIGRGGMGVVYLARDLKLDRAVAIKTLPPHLAMDAGIRERFLREARTAGALSHPNIVPIHRADELDGLVFFVMGLVDGDSMAQHIRDARRIPPRDVLLQMRDVADALGYAHSRGVVHRDIKAENILIDRTTGRAMVTDFGIARLAESAPLTSTGQLLGTVFYLSPEQISGDVVDGRSDLYALGVAGYFAAAGRFPFDAALASAVILAHVTKPPPPLLSVAPDVPRALAAIIDRCLVKNPADRYQTGAELSRALSAVQEEIEAAPAASAGIPLLSDAEAQGIWERAAQLQALTGIVPRPAPVPAPRDAGQDRARTSGFQIDDVRAAAQEAGIPALYVEHALAERGLAPVTTGRPATPLADRSSGGKWAGAPIMVEFEIVVPGEVPNTDFDLIGETILRTIGAMGTLSAVGRSLTWQSAGDRKLRVTVFVRGGTTTIRVSEDLASTALGSYVPTMMGGGFAAGMLTFVSFIAHHHPGMGAIAWGTLATAAFGSARRIFQFNSRKKQRILRELAENIAEQARASIEAAQPKRIRGDR